jgi:eukaryotic-like serine/threonine-protein kinase
LNDPQPATIPFITEETMKQPHRLSIHLVWILALLLGACSTPPAIPTATASSTPLPPTATPIPYTATPQPTDTPIPTPTLGVGSTITAADGAVLVYVPAGEFLMGSTSADPFAQDDEFPQHTVYLDAFWIDQYEVTNKQYAQCVEAGACKAPINTGSATRESYYGNPEFDEYPVIEMRWEDANAYCIWAERSLPTEAQWEKAARGTDGRLFTWGNDNPNENLLNYNKNVGDTTKVDSYEAGKSPYGAYDMAGNVGEWVADKYSQVYYSKSPAENPTGPTAGETHVIRGGTLHTGQYTFIRVTDRTQGIPPQWYYKYIGFRCATTNP